MPEVALQNLEDELSSEMFNEYTAALLDEIPPPQLPPGKSSILFSSYFPCGLNAKETIQSCFVRRCRHRHVCTPHLATGLNIETSYLVQMRTYTPTSNILDIIFWVFQVCLLTSAIEGRRHTSPCVNTVSLLI